MDAQPVLQAIESQLDNVESALEVVEAGLGTVVTEAVAIANTITVNKTAAALVVSGLSLGSGVLGYKVGFRRASLRYQAQITESVLETVETTPAPEAVQVSPDVKVVSPKPAFVPRSGVGPLGQPVAQ